MSVVIIPAYKPDETLITITDQLWGYGCWIVVVDDGSGEEYQPIFDKISEMNVLMVLAKAGIPIEEVPIHTIYRDKNNSGSHFRTVQDSIRICKDIFKFMLSSFSSFILDYVLFSLLMIFLPHTAAFLLAANVLARIISAFYNYSMNCRFVFHTRKKVSTALQYFELAAFVLFMNNVILEIFVQFLGLSVYPAKLMTECVLFLLSWMIQNRVIFRKERKVEKVTSDYNVVYALTGGKAKV